MKYFVLFVFLFYGGLAMAQSDTAHLLSRTYWKLENADSYVSSHFSGFEDFTVSNGVLSLHYSEANFHFKVSSISEDELVLIPVKWNRRKTKLKPIGEKLVFESAEISLENNPVNNRKYLSLKPAAFHVIIYDSLGFQTAILNSDYQVVPLTKESASGLNYFILDNRFNDTHSFFYVFQTETGAYGVVSDAEEICIPPNFKAISIDYQEMVLTETKKRAVPIICTDFDGVVERRILIF